MKDDHSYLSIKKSGGMENTYPSSEYKTIKEVRTAG